MQFDIRFGRPGISGTITVEDTPVFAHLPWLEIHPEQAYAEATATASIAGRAGRNTSPALAADPATASVRPTIVAHYFGKPEAGLAVRFRRLRHRLARTDGCVYSGQVEVDQRFLATAPLPMVRFVPQEQAAKAKAALKPPADIEDDQIWRSQPIDPAELLDSLSVRSQESQTQLLGDMRLVEPAPAAHIKNGLLDWRSPLYYLASDAAEAGAPDAKGAWPPGAGGFREVYSVAGKAPALRELQPALTDAPTLAWVHSEEYLWSTKSLGRGGETVGRLLPVFANADVALAFAGNLSPGMGVRVQGGAFLGRAATQSPKSTVLVTFAENLSSMDIGADDRRFRQPSADNRESDTPWAATDDLARHQAAISKPSARQVMLTAGVVAVRAELVRVKASQPKKPGTPPTPGKIKPAGVPQTPADPEPPALATFDFLVRAPANALVACLHANPIAFLFGRMGNGEYREWLRIASWLGALEDDVAAKRAPWAVPLLLSAAGAAQNSQMAPVVYLATCHTVDTRPIRQLLVGATEPTSGGVGARAISAALVSHDTVPVIKLCLPLGGTVGLIGVQAAVAGRAVGAILTEVQRSGLPFCLSKLPKRGTSNDRIRRAMQAYVFWVTGLTNTSAQFAAMYSIWGIVDPKLYMEANIYDRITKLERKVDKGTAQILDGLETLVLDAPAVRRAIGDYGHRLGQFLAARYRLLQAARISSRVFTTDASAEIR